MKIKHVLLMISVLLISLFNTGCDANASGDEKVAYYYGYNIGQNRRDGPVEQVTYNAMRHGDAKWTQRFDQGFEDARSNKKRRLKEPTQAEISDYNRRSME